MKKLFITTLFACFAMMLAHTGYAQQGTKNRLGFFLGLASGDIDQVGIGGIGEFKVSNKVTISPQILFYLGDDDNHYYGPGNDVNFMEININANYYFYNKDIFEFYGLGGLNFTRVHWEWDNGRHDDSHTEIGLNLGGGMNFEINRKVVPFSELRVTVGEFNQFVISGGLKFNL
jgi:outer membrane protein X